MGEREREIKGKAKYENREPNQGKLHGSCRAELLVSNRVAPDLKWEASLSPGHDASITQSGALLLIAPRECLAWVG